jgi:hypothetical protein
MEWWDQDRGSQPDGFGLCGQVAYQDQGGRTQAVPGEMVLGKPGAVVAQLLGQANLLGGFMYYLTGAGAFRPRQVRKQTKFHCIAPRVLPDSCLFKLPAIVGRRLMRRVFLANRYVTGAA